MKERHLKPASAKGIRECLNSPLEIGMHNSFAMQASAVLRDEGRFSKDYHKVIVGFETEHGLVDKNMEQVTEEARNRIIAGLEFADVELGASQLELRTDKFELRGINDIAIRLWRNDCAILERIEEEQAKLVRGGTNPFIPLQEIRRTTNLKYTLVPDFHDRHKSAFVPDRFGSAQDMIDPRPAKIISLFNSIQCNMEAKGFGDAIEKANYSYMIAPFAIALGNNARFMDCKDLHFGDVRMPLWEISHDTRSMEETLVDKATRVGRYDSYLKSMRDYFARAAANPLIIDKPQDALKIGIGLFWKDVRIKVIGDSCVVEFRPISTQPTPIEDAAMHAFYLGRLAFAQETREPLMKIWFVNANRTMTMKSGLDTWLCYSGEGGDTYVGPARVVLAEELKKAKEGLKFMNIREDGFLNLLRNRLREGTPSDRLASLFKKSRGKGTARKEALAESLRQVREIAGMDTKHEEAHV